MWNTSLTLRTIMCRSDLVFASCLVQDQSLHAKVTPLHLKITSWYIYFGLRGFLSLGWPHGNTSEFAQYCIQKQPTLYSHKCEGNSVQGNNYKLASYNKPCVCDQQTQGENYYFEKCTRESCVGHNQQPSTYPLVNEAHCIQMTIQRGTVYVCCGTSNFIQQCVCTGQRKLLHYNKHNGMYACTLHKCNKKPCVHETNQTSATNTIPRVHTE